MAESIAGQAIAPILQFRTNPTFSVDSLAARIHPEAISQFASEMTGLLDDLRNNRVTEEGKIRVNAIFHAFGELMADVQLARQEMRRIIQADDA